MNRRKNLVAVGPEAEGVALEAEEAAISAEAEAAPEEIAVAEPEWVDEDETAPPLGRFDWIMPALAVVAILGWTGFFGWVHRGAILAGASPAQWSALVV